MMGPYELIESITKTFITFGSPSAAGFFGFKAYQENQTERHAKKLLDEQHRRRTEADRDIALARENSVGAVAIADLVGKWKDLKREMEEMDENVKDMKDEARQQWHHMRSELQEMMLKALEIANLSIKK